MKKILLLLVLNILVLNGFGAVAISNEKNTDISEMRLQPQYEIKLASGLFGYTLTITNTGTENFSANLEIKIETNANFMIIGKEWYADIPLRETSPGESGDIKIRLVMGFGPSIVNITLKLNDGMPVSKEAKGFLFLFFAQVETTTFKISP